MTTKKKAKATAAADQAELARLQKIEGLYRDLKQRTKAQGEELAELREKLADQEERELARQAAAADQAAELPRGGDLASVAEIVGVPADVQEELDRLRHVKGLYEELMSSLERIDQADGYTRGKLPDGRYIKIDVRTGAFSVISLEEWNRIPAN
jgi:uncharacterized protein YicC (UPF0701 family)